jgi:2-oxoglutarate ferredoxin oxidoreductase subunit alpha
MSLSDVAVPETASSSVATRVVNDFSIQVATVNGSGSQTANLVLLRSLFQMGVPVSGKNMFPSNIAGLPTPTGTAMSPGRKRSTSSSR